MAKTFKGLLLNVQELNTQFGKSYVTGIIRMDSNDTMDFKVWGCTLDLLAKNCPLKEGDVISLTGDIESYKGHDSIKVALDDGIPMVKKLAEDADNYVYTSPLKPASMLKTLRKDIEGFHNETFKFVALTVLDECSEKFGYFPYSRTMHTEKGGCLYHLWLSYCKALHNVLPSFAKGDEVNIDLELVKTALICERYGWLNSGVEVDQTTAVTGQQPTVTEVLDGELINVCALVKKISILGLSDSLETVMLEHCLGVLAGANEPHLLEAKIFAQIVQDELEIYQTSEELRGLQPLEVKENGKTIRLL